jgi:hypothetical protein
VEKSPSANVLPKRSPSRSLTKVNTSAVPLNRSPSSQKYFRPTTPRKEIGGEIGMKGNKIVTL